MSKPIDWSKPIRCKDGRPARVLATDLKGRKYTVAIAVMNIDGSESVCSTTPDGRQFTTDEPPFVENIPERFEYVRWVNVYEGGAGELLYASEPEARCGAAPGLIATVPVTIAAER